MALKKFKGTKTTILIIIMVALVAGYYGYLTKNKNSAANEDVSISSVQDVLLRDLDKNYPPSPKEVVKYYSALTECFYNEDYTDEEFKQLADKAREMYDEELIGKNPEEKNLLKLDQEVEEYKKQKQTITSYSVSPSTDVEYWTDGGRDMATLYCVYILKVGNTPKSVNEQFILRKDEKEHWKILGWKAVTSGGSAVTGEEESKQEDESGDGTDDGGTGGE